MAAPAPAAPSPISGRTDAFRLVGPVIAPERAWALIGDTDWLNREGGNGAVLSMGVEPQSDGAPLLVGELAGPAGMRLPFREVWSSWVVGRFFRQVRDVVSPFVHRSDYHASLEPAEGGVRPVVEMTLTGPGWAGLARRGLALRSMRRGWTQALERLVAEEPTADRALGPEATAALRRWRDVADGVLVDRFAELLTHGRPVDVTRMRAYALADRWGLGRDDVLDTLVAGVDAGAVELFWSVRCRRCYGQLAGVRLLSDLADHADCPACGLQTDTDLGESVEVLFAPHPGVLPALDVNFCTVFPAAAPAQAAVLTVGPGQSLTARVPLAPGRWTVGPGQGAADVVLVAGESGALEVDWAAEQGEVPVRSGDVDVRLHNPGASARRYMVTREGGALPVVTASTLTTSDRHRRRLGHQVLAPGLRIGVRAVALLFTDLGGSTAMYEELGDARAFAVVRDHFTVLRAAAAEEGGTVVKTIGDAVMAAFPSATAAMRAAVTMVRRFDAYAAGLGLLHPPTLKVGVHVGSALAVHSDQTGLDYFGGTVNLAARAQGVAGGGEIVFTEAVAAQPEAMAVLADAGLDAEPTTAPLKGLGDVALLRVRAGASS